MAITKAPDKINKSTQEIQNLSFDTDFNVLAVELLTHNPISDTLERVSTIQGNGSLVLAYDVDGNLSTITKTIGSTSYVKTLTYTAGVLTGVSVWV